MRTWAIGGGKGGVGKSVICSNMAVALARRGHRVIVIDLDLGGANLHTLLGVPNPRHTLFDFLEQRVTTLSEVVVPTPTPNLGLISGTRATMEAANPKHTQKEKLLRHVATLNADYVLLDVGAGAAHNVTDFFIAAQRGVLVVVPEPTSIENAYHFLKAAFYRKLRQAQPQARVRAAIKQVMTERRMRGVHSPRELIRQVTTLDAEVGAALEAQAVAFNPAIVVNRLERREDQQLGDEIRLACKDYFGSNIDYLGGVLRTEEVTRSIQLRRPAFEVFSGGPFSRTLDAISRRLIGLEDARLGS